MNDLMILLMMVPVLVLLSYAVTYYMKRKGYSFPKVKMKKETLKNPFIRLLLEVGLLRKENIEIVDQD